MRQPNDAKRRIGGIGWAAAALALLTASLVVRAQQAAPNPAARPMVPLAASSLSLNPDAYYGETVALMAAVEEILSRSAFTVDQDKTRSTGKEVLILAPTLTGAVQPNTYVTVLGEVVRFDPAEIARKARNYTLDLAPDVIAKYQGRPAILATAVINSAMVDLAKRVPPPLTAAEAGYDKLMKQVGQTFTSLRTGLETPNADQAKEQVAVLKKAFGEVEAFFKTRRTENAIGWAQDAQKLVTSLEQGAAAGKWDDVKTSATTLAQVCQTCHTAHRERLEDGTFRIKGETPLTTKNTKVVRGHSSW